jgi:hypothetical protein
VTISSAPTYDTNSLAQPTAAAKTTMGQQNVSRNVSGSNSGDAVEVDGGYLVVRVRGTCEASNGKAAELRNDIRSLVSF